MVKNSPANAGDWSLIPGWGRSPREGNGNPLQYSCLGNPMDRGAWGSIVHGVFVRAHWNGYILCLQLLLFYHWLMFLSDHPFPQVSFKKQKWILKMFLKITTLHFINLFIWKIIACGHQACHTFWSYVFLYDIFSERSCILNRS